jgi:EAL domain-containing protein (putative c-di-GMP-specific phosphodiesterase class I)
MIREGRIGTLFQPIVDPRARGVCRFEALARGPSDSWLHSPRNLFESARRAGWRLELDFLCVQNAFRCFVAARVGGQLFVNVSPDSIYEASDFASHVEALDRSIATHGALCAEHRCVPST